MDRLTAAGYEQYEISNHARPGRECLHNLAYWQAADYVGLGPSAFSTVGDQRWKNVSSTENYVSKIENDLDPADFSEPVDPRRVPPNGSPSRCEPRAAFQRWNSLSGQAKSTDSRPLAIWNLVEKNYRLTRSGRMLADEIAEAFV